MLDFIGFRMTDASRLRIGLQYLTLGISPEMKAILTMNLLTLSTSTESRDPNNGLARVDRRAMADGILRSADILG